MTTTDDATFVINGILTKNDSEDGKFTPEEAELVTAALLAVFEECGWGFGGTMGRSGYRTVSAHQKGRGQ